LLWQAALPLDNSARWWLVRNMYALCCCAAGPEQLSIDQLRGVAWRGRRYDSKNWDASDRGEPLPLRGHGLPARDWPRRRSRRSAIGFPHTGKPRSVVHAVADLWKLVTVVPEAFRLPLQYAQRKLDMAPDRAIRLACRDGFGRTGLPGHVVPTIAEVLAARNPPMPAPSAEARGSILQEESSSGDADHRG
jgi:CRISPR-associated protein Cas1